MNTAEIQREYYKQLYANKFDNLEDTRPTKTESGKNRSTEQTDCQK